ncbi:MAG: hypothetical protein WAU36_01120 [Cyclobacteriaceae bacterium]
MTNLEEFLFKEYENISRAHFEAQKQFALFFRYYTIFFSVPIVLLALLKDSNGFMTIEMFGVLLIILGIIGFLFYLVTIDLKHDAVLYARTVNGVRYYFLQGINNEIKRKFQSLPTIMSKPNFYNPKDPIFLIICLVNTVYLLLGSKYLGNNSVFIYITISIASVALHFASNYIKSLLKEKGYKYENLNSKD